MTGLGKYPPKLDYIIQSYDTAFSKGTKADYSVLLRLGECLRQKLMVKIYYLLDAFKDRYEFPELRRVAYQQYLDWNPDMVIIEAKASGLPLTHELRQMDIPVINFTPSTWK